MPRTEINSYQILNGTILPEDLSPSVLEGKANVVSSPTVNDILIVDVNGQPVDSGKKFNDSGLTTNDILTAKKINEISLVYSIALG